MVTVSIDRNLAERLSKLDEIVELRDVNGRILGSFTPVRFAREPEEAAPPPLSEEEITRRMTEGPLLTTAEVLAHLRSAG